MDLWHATPSDFRTLLWKRPRSLDPLPDKGVPVNPIRPWSTTAIPSSSEPGEPPALTPSDSATPKDVTSTLPLTPPRSPRTETTTLELARSTPGPHGPLPHDGRSSRLTSTQWAFIMHGVRLGGPLWEDFDSPYWPKYVYSALS